MGFDDEIPLFLDTNLGTHFALSVPHDITAGDLKDSMAIKRVFEGAPETWLLHLHASWALNPPDSTSPLSNNSPHDHNHVNFNIENYEGSSSIADKERAEMCFSNDSCRNNEKKRNITKHHNPVEDNRFAENREVESTLGPRFNIVQKSKHYNIDENCKENLNGKGHGSCVSILENCSKNSEAISVTGILSRFFTDLDEVDSCYHQPKHPSEIESMHENNVIDHRNYQKRAESDAAMQCSVAEQKDGKKTERVKATSKKVRKPPIGARKPVGKKSSLDYIETSSKQSCKYQVGKRLVQAAISIQTPPGRKESRAMFLSMCRNMISPGSALLAGRIAFDVNDFTSE